MKHKVLVIGHSTYPQGVKGFLEFFGIPNTEVDALNIDHDNDINKLEKDLTTYIDKHEHLIIFADLTGGSPHKTAMEILNGKDGKNKAIVSGVSQALILEVALKATVIGIDEGQLVETITNSSKEALKNQMIFVENKIIKTVKKDDKKAAPAATSGI